MLLVQQQLLPTFHTFTSIGLITLLQIVVLQFVIVLAHNPADVLNSNDTSTDHVCYHEESYTELVRTPIKQPVRVRSHNWCLDFPPRCSNYKTEIREVVQLQNLTKIRVIERCCDGYAEIGADKNDSIICSPICRGGCGRGICFAPDKCLCDIGYTGRHCTQRCKHGLWGEECGNFCKCRNGAICDSQTGHCLCLEGWIGEHCNIPCPEGFFGLMCQIPCECSTQKCHPRTGECSIDDSHINFGIETVNSEPVVDGNNSVSSRIQANQWIKINASTEKTDIKESNNVTSSIINSLNSTIANLTENIDRLSKNLDKTQQIVQNTTTTSTEENSAIILDPVVVEFTTIKTVQEVILIKHEDPSPDIFITPEENQTGLHSNFAQGKPKEIIHVITKWEQGSHRSNQSSASGNNRQSHPAVNAWSAVVSVLTIFCILILATSIGFVIVYRRYLRNQQQRLDAAKENRKLSHHQSTMTTTSSPKPLPDLPAFTQTMTKKVEFYDQPKNNGKVRLTMPYCYTGGSIYSVVSKPSRKGSMEHIYDEIKYPTVYNSKV